MEGIGCSVGVDGGSDVSVETVSAVDAVVMLLFSFVGVSVVEVFVVGAAGPQLTSNKIMINPVKYGFIE